MKKKILGIFVLVGTSVPKIYSPKFYGNRKEWFKWWALAISKLTLISPIGEKRGTILF